ncbi:MAG: glycosyltransferase family 39 protein [Euryarchaeota archaeon]|nr:glycosyltransferase family 39 protein [Euryarchaeota archaeon]
MIRRGTVAILGVLALAAILRLWGLSQPIWPDEALYLQTARNLYLGRGLTFDGTPWHETQPPFFIFSLAISNLLTGTSEVSARMVAPLFGVLGVLAVYHLGKALYGERAGLLAALLMAVNPAHWFFSRMALADVPLATLLTLSAYLLYTGHEKGDGRTLALAGVAMGLACLTKRIGLLVYPITILYLTGRSRTAWTRDKGVLGMFAISIALQLPWYARNYALFGDPLVSTWSYVAGIFGSEGPETLNPLHIPALPLPILLAALWGALPKGRDMRRRDLPLLYISAFLLVLALWYRLEVSRYLIPVVPFFSLLAALGVLEASHLLAGKKARSVFIAAFLIAALAASLLEGTAVLERNGHKYEGYKASAIWINENTPADAVVVSNARAIFYYSARNTTYFPPSEEALWELVKGREAYLVVGDWPVHRGYPGYISNLSGIRLEATFNEPPMPQIKVYKVVWHE